jgi:hypothetical protein|tara:strand:+ start:8494 stop:8928 length:435 start_codon:yes stop_codon:yes gene_type:complete
LIILYAVKSIKNNNKLLHLTSKISNQKMKKKLLIISSILFLWNCEAIFVEDVSSETVVLLAPINNAEVTNGTIQFNWQEVSDASEYKIQIAKPNFATASQILLDSVTTSTVISKDLEIGDYQWRVSASNSGYVTNYSVSSFKVN